MAENDQHLKHGKALCGKVFGRFVETFNALVDFRLGLKGDAQGKNGEGHITYDRENNIIRCDGCGGKGGSGGGSDVTANEKSGLTVEDGEIDISGREEDDAFGIRTMTVKGEDDAEDKTVKFIGTEDVEIGGDEGGPDPEDVDPYEDDEYYDPDDEQDPWYENPEDSPAPGGEGGGGGGGEGGSGGGCNDWSGDLGAGLGGEANSGWSGDNCGSINDFSR